MRHAVRAIVLAAALLAGCATLRFSDPGASISIEKRDENICAVEHARLCIAQVWIYIKAHYWFERL